MSTFRPRGLRHALVSPASGSVETDKRRPICQSSVTRSLTSFVSVPSFSKLKTSLMMKSQKPRNIECTAGRSGYEAWLQGDQAAEEGPSVDGIESKRLRHPVSDGLELPLGQAVVALSPIDACAADIPQHPGGR